MILHRWAGAWRGPFGTGPLPGLGLLTGHPGSGLAAIVQRPERTFEEARETTSPDPRTLSNYGSVEP